MNNRIATALALAGSLLIGPAASAAPVEAASVAGYEADPGGDEIFDHPQDDHDHDGDGKQDHDPEDHDEDEDSKPEKPKPKG